MPWLFSRWPSAGRSPAYWRDDQPAASVEWPSFRGASASGQADGQHLPERWDAARGQNIAWTVPVPGLAHSSPIVWGDRIFLTTAISSRPDAGFKPGLYGEGDARRTTARRSSGCVLALDRATGQIDVGADAYEGVPREKRHIKATYANATPATDGRYVVAFFGSQGLYAYDLDGRPLWQRDLGVLDTGAYDLPDVRVGHGELADHLQRPGDRAVRHPARIVRDGAWTLPPARRCGRRVATSCPRGARRPSTCRSRVAGPSW